MKDSHRQKVLEILQNATKLGRHLQERAETDKNLTPEQIASLDDDLMGELSAIGFLIDQVGEDVLNNAQ